MPTTRLAGKSWRVILGIGGFLIIGGIGVVAFMILMKQGNGADSETSPMTQGTFSKAAVACDTPYCADIGKSMLMKGGSVVDAGIAALICMGLVHSQNMGIGGGFLAVFYNGTSKEAKVLNARESAPAFATEKMFEENYKKSQMGGLAVAVPGEIRGYWELWEKHGRLSWKELFEPSIKLARKGFNVTAHTAASIKREWEIIKNEPTMLEIFLNPKTGKAFQEGDTIKRKILAKTFELIAKKNGTEFYEGDVGKWFVEDLKTFGGNITMEDLKNYRVEWTEALNFSLHGDFTLFATPPVGSGLLMGFILKVLNGYNFGPESIGTPKATIKTYQRIIEAFKHAFAYRTQLGDPSDEEITTTVQDLIKNLTSGDYAKEIQKKVDETENKTSSSYEFYGAKLYMPDDHGTAQVSVYSNGDALSITSTINTYFGARIRSRKTDIIYNNEMDDFASPGIINFFGLPPSVNNFIRPGKKMLSSMSPAITTDKNGKVRLVIGSAGGTKIITATTLVALRNLWFNQSIFDAVDSPRFHHQLTPMQLEYDEKFPEVYKKGFRELGHKVVPNSLGSAVTALAINSDGSIDAKADTKRKPSSVAGY